MRSVIGCINLSDVSDIPHSELFQAVADVITRENLIIVNEHSQKVVFHDTFYTKYGKRLIDIIVALIALVVTFPINLVLLIATFFDVGSPIFFSQKRIGYKGHIFSIIKFRNMTNETNEMGELLPPSERVTRLGAFVRKTSLDELLNFWSVLKGDMSLIGPRPLLVEYYKLYSERHFARHEVKPGLECPVINKGVKRETWLDQFENDVYYVENISLLLDMKMVFLLIKMVFDRKGTSERGKAERGSFLGYEKDGTTIDSTSVPMNYYEAAIKELQNNISENKR